jgi:hypothetical protein
MVAILWPGEGCKARPPTPHAGRSALPGRLHSLAQCRGNAGLPDGSHCNAWRACAPADACRLGGLWGMIFQGGTKGRKTRVSLRFPAPLGYAIIRGRRSPAAMGQGSQRHNGSETCRCDLRCGHSRNDISALTTTHNGTTAKAAPLAYVHTPARAHVRQVYIYRCTVVGSIYLSVPKQKKPTTPVTTAENAPLWGAAKALKSNDFRPQRQINQLKSLKKVGF